MYYTLHRLTHTCTWLSLPGSDSTTVEDGCIADTAPPPLVLLDRPTDDARWEVIDTAVTRTEDDAEISSRDERAVTTSGGEGINTEVVGAGWDVRCRLADKGGVEVCSVLDAEVCSLLDAEVCSLLDAEVCSLLDAEVCSLLDGGGSRFGDGD